MPQGQDDTNRKIDLSSIPLHTQESLAAATMDLIRSILSQPGGRERLDRKIAELNLK